MNLQPFYKKNLAFLLAFLLLFTQLLQAHPMPQILLRQDDSKVKKLPPANWIRSRMIDVKHIAIDLKFDWEKEFAFGTTTVTLAPFKAINKFYLDAAMMTINSVKLTNGTALKFNYDGKKDDDNLEILLDRNYKGGEDISVTVDYKTNYVNTADADTAIGGFGRGLRFIKPTADNPNKPRQIWSQGESEFNRYWFPSYDTPNDFRTTELRATVEKPYTVVSNGKLVSDTPNADETHTVYWKMDIPYSNYLTSIVISKYTEVKQEIDGTPIVNYAYPNETKEVAATTKNLPATIKFFGDITGVKYPYPKYSQAFVEDFGGGMENISATTQIEEMIHDDRELLDEDSESLQSHELAHQWFGDFVTCREWGQIWLNESFATYFQGLWDEKHKGHDYFLYADVLKNHNDVLGSWNGGVRRPIVTKYYANKDAMFDNYAYPGGGSVLHMLRKHLGDDLFFKSINNYLVSNAHQPVSTEELRIAIEETSGESMDWFFDQWLYRMGHPIFEITKSYDAASKKLTLNVKQTQTIDLNKEDPQAAFFQAKVDVEIDNKIEQVWLKPQAENVFTFDSATEPKLVNFDYEDTLLKEIKFEKSVDELIYQAGNDKDVLGRVRAIRQLSIKLKDSPDKAKFLTAFQTIATNDSLAQIRRDALNQIGNIVSPPSPAGAEPVATKLDEATAQTILKATKDAKSIVRARAFTILSETEDAKYGDLYLAALNDQSYAVIDSAATALAATKNPKAYDALMKLVNTESWKGHLKIAGLNGLAELGDKRSFDMGYKLATDPMQPSNVRATALIIVAETGKGDKRAFPLIFDGFKKSLDANDIQGIVSSISAIIKLADPRGQEAFDLFKAKFKSNPQAMNFIANSEAEFKAAIK